MTGDRQGLRIAAAPISWGVCEVPGWGHVRGPGSVLADMAELGIAATELGPPGYLPEDPTELRALLKTHSLDLVGGFLAVPLHTRVEQTLAEADRVARLLSDSGAEVLVLAAATGLDGYDARPTLSAAEWDTLLDTARRVATRAADHGMRTVLHPHVGTQVEQADEVADFLAQSPLPLCLDTGHLMIGGVDPVELAARHPDRIGHVHLKDVRTDLALQVRSGELAYTEAVRQGIYVPLGEGDIDIAAIVDSLTDSGYDGWYVLEQDTTLAADSPADLPRDNVARSLAHLATVQALPR